ncbi:MAG TPA: beta-propeller domain-containing protein [Candidatus Limnocylindrales bacterium]
MRRALAILTAFALVGCTNIADKEGDVNRPAPAFKLVSYQSCDELLASLKAAAKRSVGPNGFGAGGDGVLQFSAPEAATGARAADSAPGAAKAPEPVQGQDFSGTNTHEVGVDEPDMVKTDGKRIVIAINNWLHVLDADTKREIGRLQLEAGAQNVLMHRDRVLVIGPEQYMKPQDTIDTAKRYSPSTLLQLIDIKGEPKVVSETSIEGYFVDARQIGGVVRAVVRSTPEIQFPRGTQRRNPTTADRVADNRSAIDAATIDAWLPQITVDGKSKRVDCSDLNLPEEYSAASLVTLASFDLGASTLSDGDPITVAADGNTVYGSGANLYLAHDQSWRGWNLEGWNQGRDTAPRTDLFQFDITKPKPVYVAAGRVPGWLLNQYSLSEHDKVLRVATTQSPPWRTNEKSSSSVYTLRQEGGTLKQIGEVGGLGKGERIYAVRFVGTVGYVVTFRRTDPLYTLDLGDPAKPKVLGELKIPGYSAYLHPVGQSRLVGVGQDADDRGRVSGTQISLFDVGNLADPQRLDQHKIARSYSEAENDPHAFLYWPATKLLVVPVTGYRSSQYGALLLRVDDRKLTELGMVSHDDGKRSYLGQIRRSLIIGDVLWTISHGAAKASTLDGSRDLATLELQDL